MPLPAPVAVWDISGHIIPHLVDLVEPAELPARRGIAPTYLNHPLARHPVVWFNPLYSTGDHHDGAATMTTSSLTTNHAETFLRLGGRLTKPECYADARRIWPLIHPNTRRAMVNSILEQLS